MSEVARLGLSKKENRDRCWKARDDFYACLDSNDQDASKCESSPSLLPLQAQTQANNQHQADQNRNAGTELRAIFEQMCSRSWVGFPLLSVFSSRRGANKRQRRRLGSLSLIFLR